VARWGLLVTTLAMGLALIGTAVSGWVAARAASGDLSRASAADILFSVRHGLRGAGSLDPESLREVHAELEERGVRFIAILDADGRILAAAGTMADPATWRPPERGRGGPQQLQRAITGPLLRVTAPLMPGPGRRFRMAGPRWERSRDFLEGKRIVVELAARTAQAIRRRALVTLATSFAAAGLLALAAIVFWRQSRRAETAAVQLERDRQLKALGQMSAVLGHELRNPLASLKGHAQLLLEKLPAGQPGRRGAEIVVREAVRLEELAAQVLEFVRTGAVSRTAEDPVALARSAARAVGEERVALTADGAPASFPLDRARMEEVLVNLLRNALSAAGDAPAAVELAVGRAGAALVYEVRDRGEGLAPGDEERIFEPFFTRRAKGTGLGLAVARKIVEGHGGTITAASRPGGGAVFRVTLPPA
jgi:two-component system sensor histidine kinase HydH